MTDFTWESINEAQRAIPVTDIGGNARLVKAVGRWCNEKYESRRESIESYDRATTAAYCYCSVLSSSHVIASELETRGVDFWYDLERWFSIWEDLGKKRSQCVRAIRKRGGEVIKPGTSCDFCQAGSALEVHHIVPLHAGGTHNADNCMTVCRECHVLLHRCTDRVIALGATS